MLWSNEINETFHCFVRKKVQIVLIQVHFYPAIFTTDFLSFELPRDALRQFLQNFWSLVNHLSDQLSRWLLSDNQVMKPDGWILGWCGYIWSSVLRPVAGYTYCWVVINNNWASTTSTLLYWSDEWRSSVHPHGLS